MTFNKVDFKRSELQDQSLLSPDRLHFSLVQFRSFKDPAHHIPNQTEIATEEFRPKSLSRKQNEIDFIERHLQRLTL